MEPIQMFVDYWGITSEHLLMIGAVSYLVTEALKKRLPAIFKGGWKTMVASAAVTVAPSYKAFAPNWESVIVCAVICWLVPEGIHAAKTNGGTK